MRKDASSIRSMDSAVGMVLTEMLEPRRLFDASIFINVARSLMIHGGIFVSSRLSSPRTVFSTGRETPFTESM